MPVVVREDERRAALWQLLEAALRALAHGNDLLRAEGAPRKERRRIAAEARPALDRTEVDRAAPRSGAQNPTRSFAAR